MEPSFILILVVGLGALLFMNWRTRKKQQQQLSFRDTLEVGQQVQTVGGLIGTITEVEGDRITLETTPGTEVVFIKMALAKLIEDEAFEELDEDDDAAVQSPVDALEAAEDSDQTEDIEQAEGTEQLEGAGTTDSPAETSSEPETVTAGSPSDTGDDTARPNQN